MRRRLWTAAVCTCAAVGMTGCAGMHRPPKLMLLTVWRAPVELESPPAPPPTVLAAEAELPNAPVAAAGGRLPGPRRRPRGAGNVAASGTAPQSAADAAETETVDIGSLTAGGDSSPQARQEATELIGSTDRRLRGLSSTVVAAHRAQIARVKNFQQQAQRALASGDADGALTLATKGKVLLDDLLK